MSVLSISGAASALISGVTQPRLRSRGRTAVPNDHADTSMIDLWHVVHLHQFNGTNMIVALQVDVTAAQFNHLAANANGSLRVDREQES